MRARMIKAIVFAALLLGFETAQSGSLLLGEIEVEAGASGALEVSVREDGYWIRYPMSWPLTVSIERSFGIIGGDFTPEFCAAVRKVASNAATHGLPGIRTQDRQYDFGVEGYWGDVTSEKFLRTMTAKAKAAGFVNVPARILNPFVLEDAQSEFSVRPEAIVNLFGVYPLEVKFAKAVQSVGFRERGLAKIPAEMAGDLVCDLFSGDVTMSLKIRGSVRPIEVITRPTLSLDEIEQIHLSLVKEKGAPLPAPEMDAVSVRHILNAARLGEALAKTAGGRVGSLGSERVFRVYEGLFDLKTGRVKENLGRGDFEWIRDLVADIEFKSLPEKPVEFTMPARVRRAVVK